MGEYEIIAKLRSLGNHELNDDCLLYEAADCIDALIQSCFDTHSELWERFTSPSNN